jgi:hypothetical protein
LAVSVTVQELWLTLAIVQLACPLALVVAVQLCAELPEPMVNVTVCPLTGVPAVGSLLVSTPLRVTDPPLVSVVGPV